MSEEIKKIDEQVNEIQENQNTDEAVTDDENATINKQNDETEKPKKKLNKKALVILGVILVAIIGIAFAFLYKSEFERVKDGVLQIAGQVTGNSDYFEIDTYPDVYENMDPTLASILKSGAQENALEAIKYANEALGFNGSLYSKMMETSALMGRQYEENEKYKVSWRYHPDDGLEVTYEKK